MPQSQPEQIATKIQLEIKRLAPNAVVRLSYEGFKEDGADIYIYAPRKVMDMLSMRAQKMRDQLKGNKMLNIRVMADAFENMSAEAKKKYGIPA